MRLDKLTTAFQQALADAQSLAVGRDNPYIEPSHLLSAMLSQPDGPKALLDRAGANTAALKTAMDTAINGLPSVQGGGPVQPGRDLLQLLQAADKEAGKRATSSLPARCSCWRWPMPRTIMGGVVRGHGLTRKALDAAINGGARRREGGFCRPKGQREALKKYTLDLTERARRASSTR
jgi:ATP-dependent Clp protease ATP-binding subunit ClpB